MNILIVTQFVVPHGGGLSSHIEDLISCLNDDGHKVELLEGRSTDVSRCYKLACLLLSGCRKDPYMFNRLENLLTKLPNHAEKLIENNSFDLIHCHDPCAGYAVHTVLSRTGQQIPVIETIHGPLAYEAKMVLGWEIKQSKYLQQLLHIEKQAYRWANQLIAVDTGQANIAINDFGINKDKVTVIFNSVSCKTIDFIVKEPPSIKATKPYLLVPRRLVEKTGVRVAIEALTRLDADIKVNLVIAGDGPLKGELQQLTKNLGYSSRVMFLGAIARQEVLRLANSALAVVIPSVPSSGVVEATSIAAIEAMACGTPVIASNIGGLMEIIQHNRTGFLVPHSDPQRIADVVSTLLIDQTLVAAIRRQARQYVLQNLDIQPWFTKIKRIYDSVLN